MKRVCLIIIILVCLLIVTSCVINNKRSLFDNELPENQVDNNKIEFAIYQVLYDTIDIENMNLDSLPLEDDPIITDKDVISYDWNEHKMVIRHNETIEKLRNNNRALSDKPFVVVVEGKNIYMGASWSLASSAIAPSLPLIDWSEFYYKENVDKNSTYTIQILNNDNYGDYRNDKRVNDVLKKLNKLKQSEGDDRDKKVAVVNLEESALNKGVDSPEKIVGKAWIYNYFQGSCGVTMLDIM